MKDRLPWFRSEPGLAGDGVSSLVKIYIVLVACLMSDPKHCREFSVGDIEAPTTLSGMIRCGIQGQSYAAYWADEHPDWEPQKVSCYTEPPVIGDDL